MIKSPNARDQSAFCAFHTFLVVIKTNAAYIQSCNACVITTRRLEFRALVIIIIFFSSSVEIDFEMECLDLTIFANDGG